MIRFITARPRLFAGLVLGLIVYPFLPHAWLIRTRLLCAWDAGVLTYLVLAAILFFSEHIDRMPSDAERQQEGEWTIFGITLAVVIASFVAVLGDFSASKQAPALVRNAHVLLVGATLLSSWLMLHVTFCFRYAHEFYTATTPGGDVDRGLDFPSEKQPDYLDFWYFALVLGMTFQVSDVQITARKMRRLATLHGLLSFLFNTVLIALTVNIAASLL